MNISEHVPLAPMTTFRIGGTARYFARVSDERELSRVLSFARERNLPLFVLGGGSNVLVADDGFPGLVVRVEIPGVVYGGSAARVRVSCGAGVSWDGLVADTVHRGLHGFENLSGIPGSVGAAPVQNIGAYGVELESLVARIDTVDVETGELRSFVPDECAFGYRDSFFKGSVGKRYVITRVHFNLSTGSTCDTSYRDLAEYFCQPGAPEITPSSVRGAVLRIRAGKFPDLSQVGTAGSFFKNPVLSQADFDVLRERFPGVPGYAVSGGRVKVPLAWILDHILALRGTRTGDVGAHTTQPIVIVNYGRATARDVDAFAEDVRARVRAACGIDVEREVVRVA